MKRIVVAGLTLLVFVPTLALAKVTLPQPIGFVTDLGNVLSDQTERQLTLELSDLQQRTSVEIAILTVDSLQGRPVEEFALDIARTWGIGTDARDNGLLVIVAPHEKEARIEVGYGLEGFVTDAQSSWIVRQDMLPAFQQGNYDKGLLATVERLGKALEGVEEIPTDSLYLGTSVDLGQLGFNGLLFFFFFVVPWFAAIFGRSKRWWPGGLVGGLVGVLTWLVWGITVWAILGLGLFGFGLDYFVSKNYREGKSSWWAGGRWGGGGGFGGGFGGFGGGSFGGGGASGRW